MVYLKTLAVIALIVSIGWVIADPGFEAALAVVASISGLGSLFLIEKRNAAIKQHQSVSKSSIGVQAGGNVTIGNSSGDKHVK